tara:strand:- start:337 stop:657 length:321 start_codon:yes stop_codon:yes gene_type:complete
MNIEDIDNQTFIEKVGKFEDIKKLQALPEFKTLEFCFKVVSDNALRELVTKQGLSLERQCELKAIIKVCRYNFGDIPAWLDAQAKYASEILEQRIKDGTLEMKNLT